MEDTDSEPEIFQIFVARDSETSQACRVFVIEEQPHDFNRDIIEKYSPRNAPDENVTFYIEFLTNPAFTSYRFPYGSGLHVVFCTSDDTAEFFHGHGYIALVNLAAN